MDRESAVLRAEMSRTRAELDQKLSMLQEKVDDLKPRRLAQRYLPDYFGDRLMGGVLTLVGLKMAWARYRELKHRRGRTPHDLADYGRWH
jgi:hypothetical protein